MSALGDYVHYTAAGYDRYGINRPHESGKPDWGNVYISTVSQLLKKSNECIINNQRVSEGKLIQDKMQGVLYEKKGGFSLEAMYAAMEAVLQTNFKNKIATTVNSNLSVSLDEGMQQIYSQIEHIKKSLSWMKKQKTINIENLTKKCQDVLSLVTSTTIDSSTLNTWLSSINTQVPQIEKQLNKLITDLSGNSSQSVAQESVSQLYRIARTLTTWPNLANQNGDIFEFLPTLLSVDAQDVADDTIEDYLQNVGRKMIKGDKYVEVNFKVLPRGQKKRAKLNILDENNEKMWVNSKVRNKIDVTIEFNIPELKEQPLNLSMKNYTNLSEISLISNTPLTTVLSSTISFLNDDYAFANHYLNLIAKHYNTLGKNAQEQSLSSITYLKGVNQIMHSIVMEIGLLGYSSNNQPDFFVMNNQSQSKITVYSMQALLGLIQNNILSAQSNLQGVKIEGLPEGGSVDQTYVLGDNGANERIVSFLYSLQSNHKISAHIQESILQQYMTHYNLTP